MKRTYWYALAVAVIAVLLFAMLGRAEAASPHTTDTNRQYIERVHGYAHGNSLGIQALRRTTDSIEAVNVKQDAAIASKVSTSTFKKDQARQDAALADVNGKTKVNAEGIAKNSAAIGSMSKDTTELKARANQADLGIAENKATNVAQGKTLDEHGSRLDGHDAQLAGMTNVNAALNTRLGGAYQRLDAHEQRISGLERDMDKANEANAISLAVAGHQFDTKGGFQTAVSLSTVNGRESLAIGMGGALNDRVFVNAGVSSSGNTTGGVVSSTYSW